MIATNNEFNKLLSLLQVRLLKQLILVLLFSGLLSFAFLDNQRYYFAWFAFVPLLLAVDQASMKKTYFLGVCAGEACL